MSSSIRNRFAKRRLAVKFAHKTNATMEDQVNNQLFVHSELENEQEITTSRFCCPIYIANGLGVQLSEISDFFSHSNAPPKIRSGTLTFIASGDDIYGVTCRHVVVALEEAEKAARSKHEERHKNIQHPPWGHLGFRLPKMKQQVHINATFYKAVGDEFTGSFPDLAIARIPRETFDKIGREAIPIDRVVNKGFLVPIESCGIATGYPEKNRNIRKTDALMQTFVMPTAIAIAPIICSDEKKILLHSPLEQTPDADNLSGMSGGPVIWSDPSGWRLLGIVRLGRDIQTNHQECSATEKKSVIWIEGEPLTREVLDDLIRLIPHDEKALPYYAPTLVPLNQ